MACLTMLSVVQPIQRWIVEWSAHSELENVEADIAVTWFEVLPSHLSGGNDEHHKNHQSTWRTSFSGKWHRITVHMLPDILRCCNGLIMRVKISMKDLWTIWPLKMRPPQCLKMSGTKYAGSRCHIPEELIRHPHHCRNICTCISQDG
jgi:hypothetical protein